MSEDKFVVQDSCGDGYELEFAYGIVDLIDKNDNGHVVTEFYEDDFPHTGKWISVKDRLPEEREKVIILLLDGQIFRAEIRKRELLPEWWYYYAADCIDMDELGYMYPNEGGNWWYGNPVTHWMPLPELPEEVAQ